MSAQDLHLAAIISQAWSKIVGEPMCRYCFPIQVKRRRLKVGVTSTVWLTEATYLKDMFLTNVQKIVGPRAITDVSFSVLRKAPLIPERKRKEIVSNGEVVLSCSQRTHLEEALNNIQDLELREQMRRVLIKSLRVNPTASRQDK